MGTPRTCTYCGEENSSCKVLKIFDVQKDAIVYNMCPSCQERYGCLEVKKKSIHGAWNHKRQELAFSDDHEYDGKAAPMFRNDPRGV